MQTYVLTLQEVEKICRTSQSHVMLVRTIGNLALCSRCDEAEQLPVLTHKLPFSVEVAADFVVIFVLYHVSKMQLPAVFSTAASRILVHESAYYAGSE